ncbi:putative D-tyrosyl-tRNA(Tyr) deacylase 2 [Bactrocera neohumeralis]|uniref:putative D-tyrosyl-tRNA(Tyr) deacylase 2 n=1 Tax=Bactrocera neohumeralis TaxID=98809 RepID=UPI0021652AF7|nr:putative D-tyrosyl-tRNA(Tyr) deacylase 2 [Bactrocera neohumeralis]
MPIRVILQGISQASLLVDNDEKYVHCGRGVLVYVAFLKPDKDTGGITDEDVARAVHTLLETNIFTHFNPEKMVARAQSLAECPKVDIMIVPQASLGGKINKKGHSVQFHHLVSKDIGEALYERFCHHFRVARGINEEVVDANGVSLNAAEEGLCTTESNKPEKWVKYDGRVVSGTFGNRQGLFIESDGPFTHTFDL